MAQEVRQLSPDGHWRWNGTEWVPTAPAVIQAPPGVPWARPYESPGFRAMLVTIFIAINIVGLFMLAAVDLLVPANRSLAPGTGDTQLILVGILSLVTLIVYFGSIIPAVVFFCMWVHRIVRNMPALGSWDPRWSPAGAVGRCFIPFLNLAHPMSGTLEAWRAADPSRRWINVSERKAMSVPGLIIGWWSLWLISNLVVNIGSRLSTNKDLATAAVGDWISVAGLLMNVGAAILAMLVIRAVTSRQDRKNELIATGQLA